MALGLRLREEWSPFADTADNLAVVLGGQLGPALA